MDERLISASATAALLGLCAVFTISPEPEPIMQVAIGPHINPIG